jgi:putative hydrolase of the HAD superfamily
MNTFSLSQTVRAVVFDAVGTLIHPHPPAAVVYAEVGRRHGNHIDIDGIRRRFAAAFEGEEAIDRRTGWRTSEERERRRWRNIVSAVLSDVADPQACFVELYFHFARANSWKCDPDAAAVLAHLAGAGFPLAIASNYDSRLRKVVAERPELAPISQLVISSEVGWRKPACEFFDAVCYRLKCTPDELLYVGDDLANDFEGACSAGLHAILLDPVHQIGDDTSRIARLTDLIQEKPN